jgi:hypothetical protein
LWKPDYRPRLNEWVTNFALAGRAALEPTCWASRMVLFSQFYWLERAELAELDGTEPAAVRRRIVEARNVSTEEIFQQRDVTDWH